MASNPIDCIKLHTKYLSTDENISREAATDLALKEFEKLHGELETFKKLINPKYTKQAYVSPDKSARIKEIQDEYQAKIDEANTPIPEPTKVPVTKSEGGKAESIVEGERENVREHWALSNEYRINELAEQATSEKHFKELIDKEIELESKKTPKLAQDDAESKYAVGKLTEQNQPSEELVKNIERKAESQSEADLNEVVQKADELIDTAVGVKRKKLSEINTDESRFQGRGKLNEGIVNEISKNFSDADQDPIHIWADPKDGKTYVLSGHHRYYGAKKAGRADVKVIDRTKDFTEQQAIKFAKEEANANRSMETPLERANTLREKRQRGDDKKDIAAFLDKEGKNKTFVDNLSYLNPKGKAVELLTQFERAEDKQTQKESERIADWIGEARKRNENLTNQHENEMFDYLKSEQRVTNKVEFVEKVSKASFGIRENEPLNLKKVIDKSENRIDWEDKRDELKSQVNELKSQTEKDKQTGWTGLQKDYITRLANDRFKGDADAAEKEFKKTENQEIYNKKLEDKKAELKSIQDKLAKHLLKENDLIKGDKAQQNLFEEPEPEYGKIISIDKNNPTTVEIKGEERKLPTKPAKDKQLTYTVSGFGGNGAVVTIHETPTVKGYNSGKIQHSEIFNTFNEAFEYADRLKKANVKQLYEYQSEKENKTLPATGRDITDGGRTTSLVSENNPQYGNDSPYQKALRKVREKTPQSLNETKQEPTKDIKPEQAEQKPQPEKTIVEDKQGAEKTKQQEIADKVRALKVNLSKLSGGGLQSNPLGLPVAVWNGAMDIVAKTIEVTGNVADAIQKGIKYIQKNHRGQWDKKGFNDQVLKELGVRGITVNGEDLIVKNDAKTEREYAKTVNGWYSDLEQSVLDVKGEQGRGENWIKVLGKSDEAKWTGLNDWLSQQKGTVSKKDIQNFLKDNRIEVVEVVKGEVSNFTKDDIADVKINQHGAGNWVVKTKEDGTVEFPLDKADDKAEAIEYALEQLNYDNKSKRESKPKFQQYQTEGEKSNYKEVLVTMPDKKQLTYNQWFNKWDGLLKELYEKYNVSRVNPAKDLNEKMSPVDKKRFDILKSQEPSKEKTDFRSSHFDEPNILVHLRMNTRVDSDGKRVLFLEEVQSDFAQAGRKQGFKLTEQEAGKAWEEADKEYAKFMKRMESKYGSEWESEMEKAEVEEETKLLDARENTKGGTIPQAPFVTDTNSWTKLGLKVALKEAVKQGADKIAWTTGEQQNDRYDLSKQVDWINAEKTNKGDYKIEVGHKDNRPMETQYLKENELEANLGKELATKIINDGGGMYRGLDLKVGGKGMKGFYGSPKEGSLGIVGNVAKSLFKQEPKTTKILTNTAKLDKTFLVENRPNEPMGRTWLVIDEEGSIRGRHKTESEAEDDAQRLYDGLFEIQKRSYSTQHSIDITPELKAEVEGGLPLFKDIKGRGKEIADLLRKGKIKSGGLQSNIAGLPIAVYNGAIEVIARALEGGATLTQAINRAYQKLKIKEKHKNFNQDEFIKKLEEATGEKFEDSEGAGKEPPIEPPKKEGGDGENKETAGITHAANEVRRMDRALPEYQKSPQTFEEWNNEAEKAIKDGYDVEKLMDKIEAGHDPTPVENAIRKIYIATIDAEIAKNPTDELLAKQKRFIQIGDLANSRAGRNLVSLKGEGSPLSSISDFYVAKMEAAGVDRLTDQQKKETKEAFDNVQKADANATAAMEAYVAEIAKLKAENELLRQKKETKTTTTPKTREEFVAQRKTLKEKLKQQLEELKAEGQKMGIASDGGLGSMIITAKMAKTIGEIAKSHVNEIGVNLKEVVRKTFEDVKDLIVGITEKDIQDVLAGEYIEPRPTRNELAAKMRDLKDEAYYINKLDRLVNGKEPRKEREKVKRNKQITELQQKIKDLQKELPPTDAELKRRLAAIKTKNENEAVKIKERISKGDFETKKKVPFLEDPEMQKKFPKEYKAALDAIVAREDARHDFDIALMKDQMAKRNLGKKGIDLAGDIIGTTKALVTGIDASGIGIQNLVAMIAHPRSAVKALPASFTDFVSAKNQERWLASVHSSELFPLAKKAGLDITEPKSLKASEREDMYTHNLLDRTIKYKGKKYIISKYITKPFERIFTGLGNRMRWNLWQRGVAKLYEDGFKWESHPEEFKALAKVLNTETGRGSLHPQVDKAFNLVSAGIWSPRLMASRMNILGLGDIGNMLAGGNKGYYGGLTPRMRAYALKDVAKFIVFGTLLMGLAGLSFADDVDLDPNSSTFGTFSVNGKRYNIWGGFTQYVRLIAKLIAGGEKKTDGTFAESNQLKTSLRFLWSKTTPAVGTGISLLNKNNADYMGKPVTGMGALENLTIPLSIRGIAKGVDREGWGSVIWTGIPSFVGVNVNYESDFNNNDGGKPQRPKIERPKPQKISRE